MTTIHQPKGSAPEPRPLRRNRAMLAHDLRSALQGVIGGVAILDETNLAPGTREQVDRIGASARTLARLVRPLIGEEDEGEDGEEASSVVRIELAWLMRHVAKRWAGEAGERGLTLTITTAPDAPAALDADAAMLRRALDNLVGNAIGHTQSGEVRLCVRRTLDGGVGFRITDDGPGVPQEAINNALRPAQRSPLVGPGRHGLGLHIVRSFCDAMGAGFALANREAGGTEAEIMFPADRCGDAPILPPDAPRSARSDLTGVRILLAEDNPTNQLVATQMLGALNADVTLASDGVEALKTFEEAEFDLIVVDIEMPRMTGLDVIRAIRGRPDDRRTTPIVALTAYAMREHRDRIFAAGANGLISKPVTSVDALGEALRGHAAPAARLGAGSFAEEAAPAPGQPVADLEVFDALCAAIGGGMMAELLEKVVADLSQARADLAAAIDPLDARPIRSASHILISVAGAIGAARLQACARALNTAAHGADVDGLPGEVRRCLVEIDAAVAFANSRRAQG